MQKLRVKVNEKEGDKIYNNFLQIKYKYQLVVKLKANKCY